MLLTLELALPIMATTGQAQPVQLTADYVLERPGQLRCLQLLYRIIDHLDNAYGPDFQTLHLTRERVARHSTSLNSRLLSDVMEKDNYVVLDVRHYNSVNHIIWRLEK